MELNRSIPHSVSPVPSSARAGIKNREKARPGRNHASAAADAPGPASPRGVKARLFLPAILFFSFLLLLEAGAAAACPSCQAAGSSENPAAADKLTQGWARSIYLLMWTPYLLFGGVTFVIVRSARRSKEVAKDP